MALTGRADNVDKQLFLAFELIAKQRFSDKGRIVIFGELKKLKILSENRAVGISFKRAASQIIPQLAQRPQTLNRRTEQAGKATVIKTFAFWGCPGLNFTANLPFNKMRAFFATLLKEMPTALLA